MTEDRKKKVQILRDELAKHYIWSFDPGFSTGLVMVFRGKVVKSITINHTVFIHDLLMYCNQCIDDTETKPVFLFEEFRVYPGHAQNVVLSEMHVPQLIGVIKTCAYLCGCKTEQQSAQNAKAVANDQLVHDVFEGRGVFLTKHELDAARHVVLRIMKVLAKAGNDRVH